MLRWGVVTYKIKSTIMVEMVGFLGDDRYWGLVKKSILSIGLLDDGKIAYIYLNN